MTARGLRPDRQVLPNGMVVTVSETHTVPAVAVHLLVRAGIVQDAGQPGLAHFVSRVIDRGTRARSADDIGDLFDGCGAALLTAVNRHALTLTCHCLSADLTSVLEVMADLVTAATYPPDEVERKRIEILTAIRQDEDNPAVVAGEAMMRLLYPDHPYSSRPRGAAASVRAIAPEDLRRFHDAWLRPDACSLVLAGDVDATEAHRLAGRVFGRWTGSAAAAPPLLAAPPVTARRQVVVPMPGRPQADIVYGFTTLRRHDPAYHATSMMETILGRYALGGRLGERIREREGLAYYVLSMLDANVIPGPLMIRAGVNPANVDRAIAAMDEEIARFAADGPTDQEVEDTRRFLVGSLPRTLETGPKVAAFLQTTEFFGLGLDYDQQMAGLLAAVTREDIHQAARRWLDPARASIAVAGDVAAR